MHFGSSQLWLLLWKDYLIRKRKPITVGGVVWAAATIISLVIVRSNVYPTQNPTCQFPSRALPSAGMLPFLQSFICTINNECESIDKYEEIPSYNKSKLSLLQNEFLPIFQNKTIMDTIQIVPNSIKLLATLTRIIDDKEIYNFVYNGFRISDIFKNPEETEYLLAKEFKAPKKIFKSLMMSMINFENIITKVVTENKISCNEEFFREILISNDEENIISLANVICNTSNAELEKIAFSLINQVDLVKYIKILGNIVEKLTSENTVNELGDMIHSMTQLSNLENYIPREIKYILNSPNQFSYIHINLFHQIVGVFEPLFGKTDTYKSIISATNIMSNGLDVLKNVLHPKKHSESVQSLTREEKSQENGFDEINLFTNKLQTFILSLKDVLKNKQFDYSALDVLSGIIDMAMKLFSNDTKHQFLYYMTLLDKLITGAHNTIAINLHMEEIMYNVSVKHSKAVDKLLKVGPGIVSRIIDGLTDVNRVQVLTRKIYHPAQMFCDVYKLQVFLKISKDEATKIKPIVCDSVWKNYITEIIENFGVNNISSTINKMASYVIAETLGKKNDPHFVSVQDFIYNFRIYLQYVISESLHPKKNKTDLDWKLLLKDDYEEIKSILNLKKEKINVLLVTVNTALAREVISNNAILESYITPTLIKIKMVLTSLVNAIDDIPKITISQVKENISGVIEMILSTLNDKEKTLNILTVNHTAVFCGLVNNCSNLDSFMCEETLKNNIYINYPSSGNILSFTKMLCNISTTISNKLQSNIKTDRFLDMINTISKFPEHGKESNVDWNDFITVIQKLYIKINMNFGYLFNLNENVDHSQLSKINVLKKKVESKFLHWKINDILQFSVSGTMHIMQILDSNIFNLNELQIWTLLRNRIDRISSLFYVGNQLFKIFTAVLTNDENLEITDLPITSKHIKIIIFNLPSLVEDLGLIVFKEHVNIQPFVNLINDESDWPCSNNSVSSLLKLKENATIAMKSIEAILCVNENLKNEWIGFHHINKISELNKNSSADEFVPKETFLMAASNFNKLINNLYGFATYIKKIEIDSEDLKNRWKYVIDMIHNYNINYTVLRDSFKNLDILLNSTNHNITDVSNTPAKLWENSMACSSDENNTTASSFQICKMLYWNALKYTVKYVAMSGYQMAADLTEYFVEITESNANIMQVIGFTKKTGPYIMFNKIPNFLETLMNSFLDQGFMKQIYRSLGKRFWDCERILDSISISPYSGITKSDINSIKPYICPSFIYWVSIPINENALLDLFAKPQFIFFNMPISNFNATFEQLLDSSLILNDTFTKFFNIKNFDYSFIIDDWTKKFQNIGQTLINYDKNITSDEDLFNSSYIANTINIMYLLEVTKLLIDMEKNLKMINQSTFESKSIKQEDLNRFIKFLEKKSMEVVEIFTFAFTEELLSISNFNEFNFERSIERICDNDTISDKMKHKINIRTLKGFCKTGYKKYIQILRENSNINFSITEFLNVIKEIYQSISKSKADSTVIIETIGLNSLNSESFIKMTTKYSYDFDLHSFFQYLNMKLEHGLVSLNFITGDDWWSTLRQYYNKPNSNIIFDIVEKSPIIIDDIINNISKLKIVRVLKDIKLNDTNILCETDITEYIPDSTGYVSKLKTHLCHLNLTSLYMEIEPIRLAAQVYDNNFIVKNEISDSNFMDNIIKNKEKIMLLLKNGPKVPMLPLWITTEVNDKFKNFNLTKFVKYDISFFIMKNLIDGLLFVNSTYSLPSVFTPWIKQINLQLIKRDEYVMFLCESQNLNLTTIHSILFHDFHWDISLKEIASVRNYTWNEMNKSLNQLLDLIQQSVYDGKFNLLSKCFFNNSLSNPMNDISLYVMLGSNIMKLIRANAPHFKDIQGFSSNPTWQNIFSTMQNSLPVYVELKDVVIINFPNLKHNIDIGKLSEWKININKIVGNSTTPDINYYEIYNQHKTLNIPTKYINESYITNNLSSLQFNSFWKLDWFSDILVPTEHFLWNLGHLIQKFSTLDIEGLRNHQINSTVNFILQMTQKSYLKSIALHLNNMIIELLPLIDNFEIKTDLNKLVIGLNSVHTFIDGFSKNINLKFEMYNVFQNWDIMINNIHNNTNLSIETLRTLQYSTIDLNMILNTDNENIHIADYFCKSKLFFTIFLIPKDVNPQILNSARIQLCNITSNDAKTIFLTLIRNINYTTVIDGGINVLFHQIIYASNMSLPEGEEVIEKIGNVVGLIPTLQTTITRISNLTTNEPIIQSFQQSSSISQLLYDPKFFTNIGNMLCGKPFIVNTNRIYKVIAEFKDTITEPDQKQLNSLPSEYCQELYREILKMDGGKILWSYAKPLLMGKILYTPDNDKVRNIIRHANESFSQAGTLFTLLNDFSGGFSSLNDIIHHNISLFTMQKLLETEFVQNKFMDIFGNNSQLNDFTKINLTAIVNNLGNITFMEKIVDKISSMTNCIRVHRFEPVENELLLEKRAAELMELNEFSAGIVFIQNKTSIKETKTSNVYYKIRMDIDNVPSTSRLKNRFWMPGPNSNFIENLRYFRGFVQLQDMIDKAIISTTSVLNNHSNPLRIRRDVVQQEENQNWEIYTQQMPYPCYIQDEFKTILYESQALVIAFFFSLILVVASVVRHLVWERESGNTSLMCVMKMKRRNHTSSWFIASLIEILVTMTVLCIILKFGNILPKSNTFALLAVLFNFGLSVTMFCYMVTSFFKSASLGAVSAVIIYLIFFMPYVIVISLEAILTLPQKIVTSLFMSTGFCYSILLIARFEVQGFGFQWKNFNESPLVDDPISVAHTCGIVFFDAMLYFIIGLIINRIRFDHKIKIDVITNSVNSNESVGVKIENISKIYKNRKQEVKALDNINITLHKGQITTLLGRNGAGKTTLIKILTGTAKPNSGNIIINDEKNENSSTKNHIGLCPQSDILLEFMTAREHLIYYARLKTNSTYNRVKYDVDGMLEIMGLIRLSEEPVYKLSGGLRRRLSVGLAFISNPHLVILDEPSSGVDPVARRDIWSLIVSLKGNRTILLTTHHLDEAELLSDNLIIMHKGKLLTSGSPLELKHKYGSGYNLTVSYPLKKINQSNGINYQQIKPKTQMNVDIINEADYENENSMNITDAIDEMKVNAKELMDKIRDIISNSSIDNVSMNNVKINLPFLNSDGLSHDFSEVLRLLEENKSILGYSNMTIECSNLEQVFLDICNKADSNNMLTYEDTNVWTCENAETTSITNSTSNCDNIKMETSDSFDKITLVDESNLRGSFFQQILALLKKRFLHYHRNYRVLIITLLLPAIFVAFAMGFSLIRPPDDSEEPLSLSSSLYNKFSAEFVSFQQYGNTSHSNNIIKNIMNESIRMDNRTVEYWTENLRDCQCVDGYQECKMKSNFINETLIQPKDQMVILPSANHAVDWIINTQDLYTEKRYGGWSSILNKANSSNSFLVWYNNKGDHALPSYINTLNSAILKYKSNNDQANIATYSHPLKLSQEQLSRSTLLQHVADVGIGVVLLIGFSLVPAGSAIYLVNERTSQEKRLQLLCGVSPMAYWISTLIWDILIIIVATALAVCVFEVFALPVYLYKQNIPAICLLLLLYGVSCSTFMHITEKFFTDASLANMILFCSNVFVGVVGLTILLIIDVLSTSDYMDYIRWVLHKIFLIFPQFALGDGLVEISKNTIQAMVLSRFQMDTYLSPLGWELMGYHYLSLILTAILFFSINILYEYNMLDKLFECFEKENVSDLDMDMEDYDVVTEKYRVELATLKPHYNMDFSYDMSISKLDKLHDHVKKLDKNDVLQVLSLRKVYSGVLEKRVAVDNLSFGVKPGQCFGLLGVNGAGKSTTFKMLTGEVKPTFGQIFISGKSVTQRELCSGLIAYCPQVDSLDRLLTVEEHLDFYSNLRGILHKEKRITKSLNEFDLQKYAHQESYTLSGGNKRKLCTAISLLGDSPIVLLDEPTSGMDPGARHNTAIAIKRAINSGRCLLLSSHSLIECETLCQRVAVTALGRFLAIGPPSYLKHKYGGGYLISIRLGTPDQKGLLIQFMSEIFPLVKVQNSHYCTTQFLVPIDISENSENVMQNDIKNNITNTKLSDIFKGLSDISTKLNIIDYTINQSSLDQVFINFSHQENKSAISKNTNRQIKLSTLERQYSKNKNIDISESNGGTLVTKF